MVVPDPHFDTFFVTWSCSVDGGMPYFLATPRTVFFPFPVLNSSNAASSCSWRDILNLLGYEHP